MTISEQIKEIRHLTRTSQAELAERIGVKLSRIESLENRSIKSFKPEEIEAFVKLGFNRDWLLTGEGHPEDNRPGKVSIRVLRDMNLTKPHKTVPKNENTSTNELENIILEVENSLNKADTELPAHIKAELIINLYSPRAAETENTLDKIVEIVLTIENELKKTDKRIPPITYAALVKNLYNEYKAGADIDDKIIPLLKMVV